jgi:hypothetical protein
MSVRFVCLGMAVSAALSAVLNIWGCPRFETTDKVSRRSVFVLYQGTTFGRAVNELLEIGQVAVTEGEFTTSRQRKAPADDYDGYFLSVAGLGPLMNDEDDLSGTFSASSTVLR